jgi:hypothetical protein
MASGGHELLKFPTRPAMLHPSMPCGLATAYSCFRGGLPTGWEACGCLLPFWTPHAVLPCLPLPPTTSSPFASQPNMEEQETKGTVEKVRYWSGPYSMGSWGGSLEWNKTFALWNSWPAGGRRIWWALAIPHWTLWTPWNTILVLSFLHVRCISERLDDQEF